MIPTIIAILIAWTILGIIVSSHPTFNSYEKFSYRTILIFGPVLTACILVGYIFAPVIIFILTKTANLVEKLANWSAKS